jgi:NADH-quinone oxidoreductase subunit J
MQIVVYSGAILILFVFVIALLSSGVKPFAAGPDKAPRIVWPAALFAVVSIAALTIAALTRSVDLHDVAGATGDANAFGSVADFGDALFRHNLLPFEVTAFILMVAIIGVVLLAGDDIVVTRTKRPREPIVRPEREPIAR